LDEICQRLEAVRERIRAAERRYARPEGTVTLLAVSKRQPLARLRRALACGQHRLGESYVQEALDKMSALADEPLEWHLVGPIQANKTRAIAEHFAWVHSVDRLKIAQRLSDQRPAALGPLQICLQVNVSGEPSKSGVSPDGLAALAMSVRELPGLQLRGLMTIPRETADPDEQRAQFASLREAGQALEAQGIALDTLSMGMTGDLEAAIAEGATIVRVGTALFGARSD